MDLTRADLTVVRVPRICVAYLLGRGGATLRSLEREFDCALLFARVDGRQSLCILSDSILLRRRAELKILACIEHRCPGSCVEGRRLRTPRRIAADRDPPGFGVDVYADLDKTEFALAFGAKGATRDKIAEAADCVVEFVGRLCVLAGDYFQRERAAYYYDLLLSRRNFVDDRFGRTALRHMPPAAAARAMLNRAALLRDVERRTGSFCLMSRALDPRAGEHLLIFAADDRRQLRAKRLLEARLGLKSPS